MSIKVKVGVCWFHPEQWDQAVALFEDSATFGESYDVWRKTTENAIAQLLSAGATPVKSKVDLNDLAIWCKQKGVTVGVKSCSEYIGEVMKEASSQTK